MQTSNLEVVKQPSPALGWLKLPIPIWLFLFTFMLPVHFHVGSLYLNSMRLLLMILVVPMSIGLLTGKYGRLLWTDILFFLFIFWVALSLAFNNPSSVVQYVGATAIEFIGGYVLGRAYVRSLETFTAVVRALIFIIIGSIPLALYENVTGIPILIETIRQLPGLNSFEYGAPDFRYGLNRAQAFLPHPILYGLFASLGVSLCFVGLKGVVTTPVRYALVALVSLSVFLALSSAAVLSVFLQFGLIAWAWVLRPVKRKWFILSAILVSMYVFVDLMSNRTPIQVFMSYATYSPHNAYWRALIFDWGMENVWNNPIFGLGLRDWVRPSWMYSPSIDNFWLLIAMRHGIPAFLLLTTGYFIALWQVGRREFPNNVLLQQARLGWMLSFVGLSFMLSTVHIWSTVFSFVFFLFGAGLWLITVEDREAPDNDRAMDHGRDRTQRFSRMRLLGAQFSRTPDEGTHLRPASSDGSRRTYRKSGSKNAEQSRPKYSRFVNSPDGKDKPD